MRVTKSLANQLVNIQNINQFINTIRNIALEYERQHPAPQGCMGGFFSRHHNHTRAERLLQQANALLVEGKSISNDEIIDFIHKLKTQTGSGTLHSLMNLAVRNLFKKDAETKHNYLETFDPDYLLMQNEGGQDIDPAYYRLMRGGLL